MLSLFSCLDQKEISKLNDDIRKLRTTIRKDTFLGSAFIRCNLQMGAHVLAQCVSCHTVCGFSSSPLSNTDKLVGAQPLAMYDKWLETNPDDVVWENLDDGAVQFRTRYFISWTLTIGLIILWAFPAAFIGSLSNLSSLCQKAR